MNSLDRKCPGCNAEAYKQVFGLTCFTCGGTVFYHDDTPDWVATIDKMQSPCAVLSARMAGSRY